MLRLYCWNLLIYWANCLNECDVFFKYCRSSWFIMIIIIERIMSTYTIYLSSESNVSMLTAINLSIVKLMTEALSSKMKEDSINFLY